LNHSKLKQHNFTPEKVVKTSMGRRNKRHCSPAFLRRDKDRSGKVPLVQAKHRSISWRLQTNLLHPVLATTIMRMV